MTPQQCADLARVVFGGSGMHDGVAYATDGFAMAVVIGATLPTDWRASPSNTIEHCVGSCPTQGNAVVMTAEDIRRVASRVARSAPIALMRLTPVRAGYLRNVADLTPPPEAVVLWSDEVEPGLPVLCAQVGPHMRVVIAARTDRPLSMIAPHCRM